MSARTLELVFPTQLYSNWEANRASWGTDIPIIDVVGVRPLTAAYQQGFERSSAPILGFVHDDVTCYDPQWKERVLHEFDDPQVGLVGFGGSTGHGDAQIYQTPYRWEQVAREGRFLSNMRNAELHGERMTGSAAACCLDGFAMFVRRAVLERSGGWPQGTPVSYWCYDYWLSCETRRQGFRIRVAGCDCTHTCPAEYRSYVIDEDCQAAHRWLYDNYRDTFPARLP